MDSDRFLDLFEESVSHSGKLFIPENMDRRLAGNLLRFMEDQKESPKTLQRCVKLFLSSLKKKTVTLKEFANDIDNTLFQIQEEEASRLEFLEIVANTKARMESREQLSKGDDNSL